MQMCVWTQTKICPIVYLPFAKISNPFRVNNNNLHRDELLTVVIFKQVVLTHHRTILTGIHADKKQYILKKDNNKLFLLIQASRNDD